MTIPEISVSSPVRQPTVRDMPDGERPRERLVEYGSKNLSNTELVAILLRTGSAGENVISLSSRLLARFGGLDGLGKAAFAELCGEKGLSEAKACQLLAALELGRRFVSLASEERLTISTSQDAANLVSGEMGSLDQEHLRVILLNTRNEVLSTEEVYVGNVNSSVVRPAEVFRPAVRNNVPSLIVVHNHPSGNPAPSDDDIAITKDLVASGKTLGIEVLDHLVIGSGNRYVSMNENGQGFQ
ncbi:MAG: JAB domain-containing protein [SAR202 cluster bacterium]|nr:JAB domain-containing protein [SAR202 cluster bacterium]